MKQALFTLLNWHLPRRNMLPLNSGCCVGPAGDVALFFGLSGAQGLSYVGMCCWLQSCGLELRQQCAAGRYS